VAFARDLDRPAVVAAIAPGFVTETEAMKIGWMLLMALAVLGIGASAAQAQCCGDTSYTTFYAAPAYSSCGTGCFSSCNSCNSCSSGFSGYSSYYTPYYSSYYTPYYSGWGWGGRAYRTGYWGWRGW
jgi:hypothetical protein